MAKKILFTLLFCATHLAYNPVFATNLPVLQMLEAEVCTAPAPDNFRITSIGGNFIALAWMPVWTGATHTLAILENDGAGGWTVLGTIYNVPGASYTVGNLQSGTEYRFVLATNCTSGEPSELKTIIDGITLIVDLAIEGRNPVKPVAVDCNAIPLNQNWKGFKVEYINAGISIVNFFELVVIDGNTNNSFSRVEIRRVYRDHPIVAIDLGKIWPTCNVPVLKDVGTSFRMARLFGGGPEMQLAGWVDLSLNSSLSINMCPDYDHQSLPWNAAYKFTALIAANANVLTGCDHPENSMMAYADFKALNPFDQTLHVFFPTHFSNAGKIKIRLLNAKGQIVMEECVEMITSEIAFPVSSLISGFYVLQIETERETQALKVIKI